MTQLKTPTTHDSGLEQHYIIVLMMRGSQTQQERIATLADCMSQLEQLFLPWSIYSKILQEDGVIRASCVFLDFTYDY